MPVSSPLLHPTHLACCHQELEDACAAAHKEVAAAKEVQGDLRAAAEAAAEKAAETKEQQEFALAEAHARTHAAQVGFLNSSSGPDCMPDQHFGKERVQKLE